MVSSRQSPRLFFEWFLCTFLLVLFLPSSVRAETATFELFDNGASTGGVAVTLDSADFGGGPRFALRMSQMGVLNVTKHGQEPGTVKASKAFREDGEQIIEFEQLLPMESGAMRRVYLVAEGLEFVWPFIAAGHRQVVSPRALVAPELDEPRPVVIESVSDSPRVFIVTDLFSPAESQALIDNALGLEGSQSLKRSTVGNTKGEENEGAHHDKGRTSENAWDSSSPAAKVMIQRSFNLTGIPYDAGKVDGLQLVRYTEGQFYNTHKDYFDRSSDPDFDFNPYSGGSNRFATVFMYIADPEEGGHTVFPEVADPNPTQPSQEALTMFEAGSLEEKMVKDCSSKLSVPPKQGSAALFYSMLPNGKPDRMSYHGACPVIKGTKWGANIWIWNRQRFGEIKTGESRTMVIENAMKDIVYVTWERQDNGVMRPGDKIQFNTFEFHRFQAHLNGHKGPTVAEYTVQSEPQFQRWVIQPPESLELDDMDTTTRNQAGGAHSEL